MKTILLENMNLLGQGTQDWISKIDKDYKEVNSEVRSYMRSDDLHIFAMLINPELINLATSSAFVTMMGFEACAMNGKIDKEGSHGRDWSKEKWTQLEYYTWLIYEAVGWRKQHKMPCLNIRINYQGTDFLQNVNDGDLGADVKTYLKLMMRQSEGFVKLFLYKDYKPLKKFLTEDSLNFTQ